MIAAGAAAGTASGGGSSRGSSRGSSSASSTSSGREGTSSPGAGRDGKPRPPATDRAATGQRPGGTPSPRDTPGTLPGHSRDTPGRQQQGQQQRQPAAQAAAERAPTARGPAATENCDCPRSIELRLDSDRAGRQAPGTPPGHSRDTPGTLPGHPHKQRPRGHQQLGRRLRRKTALKMLFGEFLVIL